MTEIWKIFCAFYRKSFFENFHLIYNFYNAIFYDKSDFYIIMIFKIKKYFL